MPPNPHGIRRERKPQPSIWSCLEPLVLHAEARKPQLPPRMEVVDLSTVLCDGMSVRSDEVIREIGNPLACQLLHNLLNLTLKH
jgi:hypothetical protein